MTAIAAERSQPFLIRHLDAPKGPSNTSFKVPTVEMVGKLGKLSPKPLEAGIKARKGTLAAGNRW